MTRNGPPLPHPIRLRASAEIPPAEDDEEPKEELVDIPSFSAWLTEKGHDAIGFDAVDGLLAEFLHKHYPDWFMPDAAE